jgi:hypothetical protein
MWQRIRFRANLLLLVACKSKCSSAGFCLTLLKIQETGSAKKQPGCP